MLIYPKFEKLSTQRGVAKLLLVLFSVFAFIGFMLILYKYNFIFHNKIINPSGIPGVLDFKDKYFINLYIQCFSGFLIVVAWLTI